MVALLPPEPRWWKDTVGEHFRNVDGQLIDALGFEESVMSWPVRRLSTGESQRLALARLLNGKPAMLLLDEPTANLDAGNRERVEKLVARYRHEAGAGVLWVTHDAEQASRVGSKLLVLNHGALREGQTG